MKHTAIYWPHVYHIMAMAIKWYR